MSRRKELSDRLAILRDWMDADEERGNMADYEASEYARDHFLSELEFLEGGPSDFIERISLQQGAI